MLIYQNIKNPSFFKLWVKKKMLWNTDPPFLTIVYWTPYPLYFDHTIHGIVKPSLIFNCESSKIAMEYTTPSHGISNTLHMVFPLPMIFWLPPYPWNIKPPLVFQLLAKCNSMVYWPSPMVYWTSYPWYVDPRLLS